MSGLVIVELRRTFVRMRCDGRGIGVGCVNVRKAWWPGYILASTYGVLGAVSFLLFSSACELGSDRIGHSLCPLLMDTFCSLGIEERQRDELWTQLVNGREVPIAMEQ